MGGVGDFGWNRYSATQWLPAGPLEPADRRGARFLDRFPARPRFSQHRGQQRVVPRSLVRLDHVDVRYNDRPFGANGYYCACDSWEETGTKFFSASQTIGRNPDGLQHRFNFAFRRHNDHFVLYRYQPEVSQNFHEVDTYQANYAAERRDQRQGALDGRASRFFPRELTATSPGNAAVNAAAAFFVLNLRPTERLSLSVGVREEVWKKWRGETSPTLAAGYWLGAGFKIRGQIGHAFRMPTYTDLYHHDPFNVGNPGLVPESAWNYEGGVDWYSRRGTRVSATWFERREDGTIDWVRDPGSTIFQSRNFQELQFHGGEIELRQRLQRRCSRSGRTSRSSEPRACFPKTPSRVTCSLFRASS